MPHVLVPTCARARGNLEGNLGQMELHDDSSNLSRIHLDRFLPSLLGWIRTARTPLIVWHAVRVMEHVIGIYERLPRKNLHIHQMEVYAVSYTHLRAHETKANLVCRLLL